MYQTFAVIPAFNEAYSIGSVIQKLQELGLKNIIICDNASNDGTGKVALEAGAIVVPQSKRGYGLACLTAIGYIQKTFNPSATDVLLFCDADAADDLKQVPRMLQRVQEGYELVVGSRILGNAEKGSMTFIQRYGNILSGFLIQQLFHLKVSDLGPMRVIRWDSYERLNMQNKNFGWTVEMQAKAAIHGLKYTEVPVNYYKRIGISKISGTLKGTVLASLIILGTIAKSYVSTLIKK